MTTGHTSPSEIIGYDYGLNQTTSVEDYSRQFHHERGAGSGSHGNPEEVSASKNEKEKTYSGIFNPSGQESNRSFH
jgi:hypothetical protein